MEAPARAGSGGGVASGDLPPTAGAEEASTSTRSAARSRGTGKLLKLVRRVHMYTGLLMFPWALIYGISGMLFNHPNVGETVVGAHLGPEVLASLGIEPWQPDLVAASLVARMNARAPDASPYALDDAYAPRFVGPALLRAPSPHGMNMMILDVESGAAILATRHARPKAEPPPFAASDVHLDELSIDGIEERVTGLLEARGMPALGPLEAHPAIGPTLRFRVRDAQGQPWNATYEVRSGRLGGRHADRPSDIGLNQLLQTLHKTHHFTPRVGALWFWALFQDLLGLTLTLWAVSGIVMWWQMKPMRTLGILAIVIALAIAGAIMIRTAEHLAFGEVEFALSP